MDIDFHSIKLILNFISSKPGGTKLVMEQNLFSALMFHLNEDFSLPEVILKFH